MHDQRVARVADLVALEARQTVEPEIENRLDLHLGETIVALNHRTARLVDKRDQRPDGFGRPGTLEQPGARRLWILRGAD